MLYHEAMRKLWEDHMATTLEVPSYYMSVLIILWLDWNLVVIELWFCCAKFSWICNAVIYLLVGLGDQVVHSLYSTFGCTVIGTIGFSRSCKCIVTLCEVDFNRIQICLRCIQCGCLSVIIGLYHVYGLLYNHKEVIMMVLSSNCNCVKQPL